MLLGESVRRCHPDDLFVIGLADHPNHVPGTFKSPYPLLSVNDLPIPNREQLSQQYTSAEFTAACKPLFIRQAGSMHPTAKRVVYLDPTIELYQPLTELFADQAILLTPYLLQPPADQAFPDEKYFQNIGLYNSGFLALNRSAEADRFLTWWCDRVPERAFIDFCQGLCTDQIWLALVPGMFNEVGISKLRGWHVGLWNIHERVSRQAATQTPLVFFNFKGLVDQDGFFVAQDRTSLNDYPAIKQLLSDYNRRLKTADNQAFASVKPAFGQQPTKLPLMGWRKKATETLQETVRFIDTVDIPRKM